MAIFHLSVKTVSRSSGRSATGAAAYRSGTSILCERTGIEHNYERKGGVETCEIVLPDGADEKFRDRSFLWNSAEIAETRKNSTVAREFEVALPFELDADQRKKLVFEFAKELANSHKIGVDFAIHSPSKNGDERNFHAHILVTTRQIDGGGLGEKTREFDDKKSGPKLVSFWREKWADLTNEHLIEAGHFNSLVDHRSLKEQKIERTPTKHLGVHAVAIERKTGEKSRRREFSEAGLNEENNKKTLVRELKMLDQEQKKIDKKIAELTIKKTLARHSREAQNAIPPRLKKLKPKRFELDQEQVKPAVEKLVFVPPSKEELARADQARAEREAAQMAAYQAEKQKAIEERWAETRRSEEKKREMAEFMKAQMEALNTHLTPLPEASSKVEDRAGPRPELPAMKPQTPDEERRHVRWTEAIRNVADITLKTLTGCWLILVRQLTSAAAAEQVQQPESVLLRSYRKIKPAWEQTPEPPKPEPVQEVEIKPESPARTAYRRKEKTKDRGMGR